MKRLVLGVAVTALLGFLLLQYLRPGFVVAFADLITQCF